jgi:DNA topoisomerase-1
LTSQTEAKKKIIQAIKSVARRLGNTVSVCRKCYIHPAIVAHYMNGAMADSVSYTSVDDKPATIHEMRREELAVIRLLQYEQNTA